MHVLVFKAWLATSFCLLFPPRHMVPEAECHSTEIVSDPSHTSASHHRPAEWQELLTDSWITQGKER